MAKTPKPAGLLAFSPPESHLNHYQVSDFFDRDAIVAMHSITQPSRVRLELIDDGSRCGEGVTRLPVKANFPVRPAVRCGRTDREQSMHCLSRNVLFATAIAALSLRAAPSVADEMTTDTMSAAPMATNHMSTDTMSTNAMSAGPAAADPIKVGCMQKAEMETDAARKAAALATCDPMAGGAMNSDQMAPAP
jgi:pentapeptide MXKDX repeat protein